jgi:class 3 adenylate cyclase
MTFSAFSLFEVAVEMVDAEAREWGDEDGLNLFLADSIEMVRQEAELMAAKCSARTGERARIFSLYGKWSDAAANEGYYASLARHADVWIFGVADTDLSIPGVVAVPVPRGSTLERERGVVVEAPSFGAALFAREAGRLDESDEGSRYFEGVLTTRQEAIESAGGALASLLKLAPMGKRWVDHDLVGSWYSRLNGRLIDSLESQKLQLRSRDLEIAQMREESTRLESMVRGYVGGQTWEEVREAFEQNLDDVVDQEREELTICFCDLVGFSKLSERLSPPELTSILNDHFSRLYKIVRLHGGRVDKFIGDAVLAYFTFPEEAFLAAKKMVQESRSVRVKDEWNVPVQVRVGLNTGFVALANLGVPEMRQRTVIGEAVNFAQRMQSAALPHSVLLSERTFSYLPFPMVRALEPVSVPIKGKLEPVQAYLWTANSDRREEISDRLAIRGSLLKTGHRGNLSERLRKTSSAEE